MNYLTMAMKLNPNLERAIEFTCEQLGGEMGRDLKRRYLESRLNGGGEVLRGFAEGWRDVCPEIERAVYLIESSVGERDAENRARTLDRALGLVLEGTRERMRKFASSIHLPTLMIYSIGVLVPLVLVALLPTFSMIGGGIGLAPVAAIYLVILPLVVYLLSCQVLSKRPNALDPTDVPTEPPSVQLLAISVAIFSAPTAVAAFFGFSKEISSLMVIWGAVSAVSVFLYLTSVRAFRTREEVSKMEDEFCDALVQFGNRVSEGRPAEDVFSNLKEGMKGSSLEGVFKKAASNVRFGGAGLDSSLFDEEEGALAGVNSRMISGIMDMLVSFVERSTRAAGRAVLQVADHLRRLMEIKAEIKRMLGDIVASMRSVAIFFAPLVASVTAKIQEILSTKATGGQFLGSAGIKPAEFTLVLAVYSLVLTALLMNYAVELELGRDRVVKRTVIAVSLPIALGVFTAGLALAGLALGALVG